jgi:phosphoribosylformylglycinamidine synthase subunit PurS
MSAQTFLARVYVSMKPTVNDPQGITIAGALGSLGFKGVKDVRSGRFLQVSLVAEDMAAAETAVDEMCVRLLANPVIETYTFEVEPAGS